jgi:protein TonB
VEVEADYPGGQKGWRDYLSKNLHYPDSAVNSEILGDVLLEFIVSKDGSVSDVKALSGPDVLKPESIRIVKESGKWIPAMDNGHNVACYRKQPIKYRLEKQ